MKAPGVLASLVVLCAVGALDSSADPITFVYSGSGSGILGESPFENAAFEITASGDTEDRISFENGYQIDHQTSSIAIEGLPTVAVVTGTHTFVNSEGQIAGYNRNSGGDLYYAPSDPAFAVWDMLSSIGPISGETELLQWGDELFEPVQTSGGVLVFTDALTTGSFQATVPEPGSDSLAAVAILAIGIAGSSIRSATRRAPGSRGAGRRARSRR